MTNADGNPDTPPHATPREPQLSADDARLIDALMESGFDQNVLSAVSREDARRLNAIDGVLGLLNDYPVEDAEETLIHATLARIDRHEDARIERMKFDDQSEMRGSRGWRIRVPDFITVAAVLLICVSVMWPVLSNVRHNSMRDLCASNMRQMAYGFSQYAADNNNTMPIAMAGLGSSALSWDKVSNVLNLEPLVRGNYCEVGCMNCPGHHNHGNVAGPSYSYRWFGAETRPVWGSGRITVIVGDLNPMVTAARNGAFISPLSISPNHAGRGQNTLVSDGSIKWLEQPIFGSNDNIWLPHGASQLRFGDQPANDADVMLTQ